MKTEEEFEKVIKDTITRYKEIIFGPDTPVCMACLEKPRKQHIDQKLYDQRLMDDTLRKHAWKGLQENIVIDGDTMTDKGKGEVLVLKLILCTGKTSFRPILWSLQDIELHAVGWRSFIF